MVIPELFGTFDVAKSFSQNRQQFLALNFYDEAAVPFGDVGTVSKFDYRNGNKNVGRFNLCL
jgi:hypothetical protein